jgi:predicted  nucleic acid-binding Zn-ribbon protein
MALYRCNRCGHLSELADDQIGTTSACPACGTDNQAYPTIAFTRTMLDRYFATRRELSEARTEIESLRLRIGEAAAPAEPVPPTNTLPTDFDTRNTDHFCSRVQVAPVLDWFRQTGVSADLDPRSLETSGHFDEVSATIGMHYPRLHEIVERIRLAQKQDYSFINIDLSKRSAEEVATLNDFCQSLGESGFLSKYLRQEGDQVVRLSLQKAEAVRRFFDGGWLSWFSFMLGLRHLVSAGVEFSVARDVSLSWPKDEGHGLDLMFLVGQDTPLCVQCRTGEVIPYLDRLVHVRDRLGVAPENYLLCVSDLTEQQAEDLSRRHGLSVATPQTLKAWFESRVATRSAA